jgi:N-methylhydantoinase B/oxoprolinase/acetone carboxylase alpha subunit
LEPLDVSIISQRRTIAPYGMNGGECGQLGRNMLRRSGTKAEETLPPIASVSVGPGDRLTIESPGGGAWGTKDTVNHEDTKSPREE